LIAGTGPSLPEADVAGPESQIVASLSLAVQELHTVLQREAEAARRAAIPELVALATEKRGGMLALDRAGPPTSEAERELLQQVMKAAAENALVLDAVVGEIGRVQDDPHHNRTQAADIDLDGSPSDDAGSPVPYQGGALASSSTAPETSSRVGTQGQATAGGHHSPTEQGRASMGLLHNAALEHPPAREAAALDMSGAVLEMAEQSRKTAISEGDVPAVPTPGPPIAGTAQPMMPPQARQGQAASAELMPSPARVGVLIRRGDEMVGLGNISAARLLYERAAMAGSGQAATAAGKTYDPTFLAAIGARGIRGDSAAALAWYQRAAALGDHEGREQLARRGTLPGE
jgi:hypothetical protein